MSKNPMILGPLVFNLLTTADKIEPKQKGQLNPYESNIAPVSYTRFRQIRAYNLTSDWMSPLLNSITGQFLRALKPICINGDKETKTTGAEVGLDIPPPFNYLARRRN